jgi:predicted nucleotidyltransferase
MFMLDEGYMRVFTTVAGSHLYGTSVPTSDYDERGVFMWPREYWVGLEEGRETIEDAKNDIVYHELRKFLRLCLACNPSVIELLFVPKNMWVHSTDTWEYIVAHRKYFLSTKARHTFTGYAHGQLKRLRNHKKWLDGEIPTDPKEYLAWKHWKEYRNPARHELEKKYGYDTKFAMHLYRLLDEGRELLLTGNITFPRPDAEFLVKLREGMWSYEEMMEHIEDINTLFDRWEGESVLPHSPDRKGAHKMCEYLFLNTFYDHTGRARANPDF